MNVSYALIADIVRSRELPDRRHAQQVIYETLGRAAEGLALIQRPYATVGDELQAVSATLADALTLTLRTHLLLPEGIGLRFGVGAGTISEVGDPVGGGSDGGPGRPIQDGSAWWAAREAIERAHTLQDEGRSFIRTWLRIHPDTVNGSGEKRSEREGFVNSVLILRDQAVFRFQPRQRRMMAGLVMGQTQVEVARQEKVSQQAVSDFARGVGSSLLEVQKILDGMSGRSGKGEVS
ncbi:SatD family protein [Actinomyces sp. ZJ308]|uniref:SatD family protein n=1 Tax=Actinomyces sp. ZJ308 TaxID=2708342 RepID=UPI001424610E|nr:SatD family protein [Actinomyces sp. ZJ308]